MYLPHAVGALITGKSPQDNENKVVSPLYT
jgi:hypothetical protein